MKILNVIHYARACMFYQAYLAEKRRGNGSFFGAITIVGIFDAPILFSLALLIDSMLPNSDVLVGGPASMTSLYCLIFTSVILLFEYIYFKFFNLGHSFVYEAETWSSNKLSRVRAISILYGSLTIFGGGGVILFL